MYRYKSATQTKTIYITLHYILISLAYQKFRLRTLCGVNKISKRKSLIFENEIYFAIFLGQLDL